ncbi:MAG: DUF1577 domain-containing protein, partial [Leptospiraceae bacterium]|nr:DUF1577 domain-containing protein [Leptospiraceae bacterium]
MAIGRSDSLQELITLMETIYGETIIGSDINLIKHLFYYLKSENSEFDIEYEERLMPVRVETVSAESVTLNVLGFEDQGTRRAKIRFEVINVLYVFEVIINEIKDNLVTIRIPTELQSAEMRKHRRVGCDDLFMNFIILFRSYKGGQYISGDNIYAERRFTHLFREIKYDEPNLKLMNLMLTDYVMRISSEYEIVIYKESNPDSDIVPRLISWFQNAQMPEYDSREYESSNLKERKEKYFKDKLEPEIIRRLLSKELNSIYIQDCSSIDSYIRSLNHPSLISYNEFYQEISDLSDEMEAYSIMENFQKKEDKDFFVSYIISPITLFDKVIGHIKVYTTHMDKHILTNYDAEYIHEMTEISSYGFTKIAIKGNRFNMLYTNTKIVDISITGLRFEIYDEKLFQYLHKHNTIKMYIPIGPRTLVINGEIVRYEPSYDVYRMGVNFFSS